MPSNECCAHRLSSHTFDGNDTGHFVSCCRVNELMSHCLVVGVEATVSCRRQTRVVVKSTELLR